jgi:hypothetical protein
MLRSLIGWTAKRKVIARPVCPEFSDFPPQDEGGSDHHDLNCTIGANKRTNARGTDARSLVDGGFLPIRASLRYFHSCLTGAPPFSGEEAPSCVFVDLRRFVLSIGSNFSEEVRQLSSEPLRDLLEINQGNITNTTFNSAVVGPVETTSFRRLFLVDALRLTNATDSTAKSNPDIEGHQLKSLRPSDNEYTPDESH